MTDTQDRLEERLEAAEQEVLALAKGNRAGGHRFRMTIPADPKDSDLVLLDGLAAGREALAALRQSQDIEAAAHGRAMADALRRVSNREAFKYVNIDWTALGAALVGEYVAALAPKAEEAPR